MTRSPLAPLVTLVTLDGPVLKPALPSLVNERPQDAAAVTALIDRAFGPGRFAKTAERLREGASPLLDLSFTCWAANELVGCVRQWPIHIGDQPAIFLGPFAVDRTWRSRGLGAALIAKACEAARDAGHSVILLVGDMAFFEPLGFHPVPRDRIFMPGPVDSRRLLARALTPDGAIASHGPVTRG